MTLAQSYDDWCTAQIARTLNNQPDYQLFLNRAGDYKNVYRADKGHVWPKDADGNWIEPMSQVSPAARAGAITRRKTTAIPTIGMFNTT